MNAIKRSIEVIGGGQVALARRLGITSAAVNQWVTGTRPVPPERCRAIEAATGGAVTRYDLRPDVFGAPPGVQPAHSEGGQAAGVGAENG
jgi:DNA-binding transcriptional regulator YdaS (Cro superfamily)